MQSDPKHAARTSSLISYGRWVPGLINQVPGVHCPRRAFRAQQLDAGAWGEGGAVAYLAAVAQCQDLTPLF